MFVCGLPEHERASKLQGWCGYIESRLRFLAEKLEYGLPIVNVRLLPKKLPLLSERALSDAQGGDGQAYLIGFAVDRDRLQGTDIHLTNKVESFKEEIYAGALKNGLLTESVTREHLRLRVAYFSSWSDMPDEAFASLGGRDAASDARRRVRRAKREARARDRAEAAAALGPSYLGTEYNDDDDPAFLAGESAGTEAHAGGADDEAAAPGMEWANGRATKRPAAELDDGAGDVPPAKAAKPETTGRVESQELIESQPPAGSAAPPASKPGIAKIKLTLT
jgi:hypothetical protein